MKREINFFTLMKDGAKDTPKDIVEKVTYETPSYYDELLTLRKEYQETKFKVRTL